MGMNKPLLLNGGINALYVMQVWAVRNLVMAKVYKTLSPLINAWIYLIRRWPLKALNGRKGFMQLPQKLGKRLCFNAWNFLLLQVLSHKVEQKMFINKVFNVELSNQGYSLISIFYVQITLEPITDPSIMVCAFTK